MIKAEELLDIKNGFEKSLNDSFDTESGRVNNVSYYPKTGELDIEFEATLKSSIHSVKLDFTITD